MREFKKRTRFGNILKSKFMLVPMCAIFLLLANSTWGVYQKNRSLKADFEISQAKLNKATSRLSELAAATNSLKTDQGVEGEIRDRLQMVKEGEREIVIIENSNEQAISIPSKKTILQKVIDFFTIK